MYRQGDILLIPILFSDLTSNKKRPVLVLSNDDYNSRTEDIMVAAITSNLAAKDYIAMLASSDLPKYCNKQVWCREEVYYRCGQGKTL